MRSLSRWDVLGALAVLGFVIALAVWWQGRREPPPGDAQLFDPSSEIQLGEEWMGLYFRDQKTGFLHLRKTRLPGGGYRFAARTVIKLAGLSASEPLDLDLQADLTPELRLTAFEFQVEGGPAKLRGEGRVEGRSLELTLITAGDRSTRIVELQADPVLRANLGPLLSRAALTPGARYAFDTFDPLTQANQRVDVEVVGPDTLVVMGQEVPVTHLRQTVSGMTLDAWMNGRGEMLRQSMGLGLVALRETEAEARWGLATTEGADLLEQTTLPVSGLPPTLDQGRTLVLRLTGVHFTGLDVQAPPYQVLAGETLTLTRATPGEGLPLPVQISGGGPLADVLPETLAAEALVQVNHARIRAAARDAAGDARDTVEATRRLVAWIHGRLKQENVVGVPSALETLESGVGDCNEHATLFAALARSLGVPTRIVVGIGYRRGRFGYHAWNEVRVADGWVPVDATWDQFPADVGHVRLVIGGLARQVEMLRVIGQLQVAVERYE